MNTITLTIPTEWLEGLSLNPNELRQALKLGLAQMRQQQAVQDIAPRVIQALLSTGRISHLPDSALEDQQTTPDRQEPPTLPGPPVSEILIFQRRGKMRYT